MGVCGAACECAVFCGAAACVQVRESTCVVGELARLRARAVLVVLMVPRGPNGCKTGRNCELYAALRMRKKC